MDIDNLLQEAAGASYLCDVDDIEADSILNDVALELFAEQSYILAENAKDLKRMSPDDPKYDRLKLTKDRLQSIADDMRAVAALPSPIYKILSETVRPNGMVIKKISVPLGVVGVIYESRPNVTLDVFSLCLKSGNVCVLKGGSEARYTNSALVSVIHKTLEQYGESSALCTLLPPVREATETLLKAYGLVDVIIPRGSSSLINYVRENTTVPVIETGAGVCHAYFDKDGDKVKGRDIVNNAKTRRVSVCNALDCLIIHESRLSDLPFICEKLADSSVIIYADDKAYESLSGHYPFLKRATSESFGTEFLDYKMSISTVSSFGAAVVHIIRYGSGHSECIISESQDIIMQFQQTVDAACIYANVSTAFTDGAQFGLGSEVGISTQKLHARGPIGLSELTTYKYLIEGAGQIRKP
ncbi:MAG: glutamate-5-semialdehyde dehydrogenase [Tannerellaceae bacterium]|jgi:glutamate-5-semialdehyde dehydrogenase|nr:glutamate-5-semialdehyde dehydrogenase [Tannerellaceae bacterium]